MSPQRYRTGFSRIFSLQERGRARVLILRSPCGEGASSALSHKRNCAHLLGGIILPVRETSGLALGNKIILHHPREAPHLALGGKEGSASCPPVTSSALRMLCVQPVPVPQTEQPACQEKGAHTGRNDKPRDRFLLQNH